MIISNDRYLMTETENSMYACTMTLVVKKLQKSDMGGYKCISKNSIGDAEGTIRLYGEWCGMCLFIEYDIVKDFSLCENIMSEHKSDDSA